MERLIGHATDKITASFSAAFSLQSSLVYVPAILLAALVIEALWVGFSRSTLSRLGKISRLDWTLYLAQQANLTIIIGYAASLGLYYAAFALLHRLVGWGVPPDIQVSAALVYFLAVDFLGYWYHRLLHRLPALWHLHHVHHSAPEFNLVNSFRSHPVEAVLSRFLVALPVAALFAPDFSGMGAAVLAYLLATKLLNVLQHSQITSDFGLVGKILVSPAHHRIHHSRDVQHHDKNFGNSLVIWDKLFGTYCRATPEVAGSVQIGLADFRTDTPMLKYLWTSHVQFLKGVARRAASSPSSNSGPVSFEHKHVATSAMGGK